jgi:hypothetical protein
MICVNPCIHIAYYDATLLLAETVDCSLNKMETLDCSSLREPLFTWNYRKDHVITFLQSVVIILQCR